MAQHVELYRTDAAWGSEHLDDLCEVVVAATGPDPG